MADVIVKFLGSGDAFGSGGRFQTCIYVDAGDIRFLIDCGASSLIAMKRSGVSPDLIDAILLSHLHGDHFGGIPFFILNEQLVSKRTTPLVIAGPPGLERRIYDAMEIFFPGSSTVRQRFAVSFIELEDGESNLVDRVTVTPYPVFHASGAPAYALRIVCAGRVIAYSGDTQWTDRLLEAARGSDLFICEAYSYEKKIKNHLDYGSLAGHLEDLDCRRLIVTHMNDDMLKRSESIALETAEDGKIISLE